MEISDAPLDQLELPPPPQPEPAIGASPLAIILRVIVVAVILGLGLGIGRNWMQNRPKAQRQRPPAMAPLVQAVELEPASHRVTVAAMGTLIASRQVDLTPRVGGEIIEVSASFLPGGRYRAGETILRLDQADYQLALAQQQAALAQRQADLAQRRNQLEQRSIDIALARIHLEQQQGVLAQRRSAVIQAENTLAIEQGQQSVAKREFDLLGEALPEASRSLVLRQPQLASAQANLASVKAAEQVAQAERKALEASIEAANARRVAAQSAVEAAEAQAQAATLAVEQTELNLQRTVVKAPFNCVVIERYVDQGAQVSAGTRLCALVGTDTWWVKVAVPADKLRWLRFAAEAKDAQGSAVTIANPVSWRDGQVRHGTATRLLAGFESAGRLAQVMVAVDDPLVLNAETGAVPPLLLGDYVQASFAGPQMASTIAVPRLALRDGGHVWLRNAAKQLEVRAIQPVWSDADSVYVQEGLMAGEWLIVSDLSTPVEGMALRLPGEEPAKPSGPGGASGPGQRSGAAGGQQ